MAHIENIWVHGSDKAAGTISVYIQLKPSGEVQVDVPLPKNFFDALIGIAQKAADLHEAQMRAEILADGER